MRETAPASGDEARPHGDYEAPGLTMKVKGWRVEFPGTAFAPAELPDQASLSESFTVENSPLLFGCRSGLCGTCLIELEECGQERLAPPSRDEAEALAIYAPDNPRARLACQIHICANLKVWKIRSA